MIGPRGRKKTSDGLRRSAGQHGRRTISVDVQLDLVAVERPELVRLVGFRKLNDRGVGGYA